VHVIESRQTRAEETVIFNKKKDRYANMQNGKKKRNSFVQLKKGVGGGNSSNHSPLKAKEPCIFGRRDEILHPHLGVASIFT